MSLRAAARLAIVAAAAVLAWLLRPITVPLFLAYLLMLVLLPLHRRLRHRLGPSGAALACTLLCFVAPLLLLLPTAPDLGRLTAWIAGADLEALRAWLEQHLAQLRARLPEALRERLANLHFGEQEIAAHANQAAQALLGAGGWLLGFFGGLLVLASTLVLLPVFLFYLLRGSPWLARLRGELPSEWHPRFDRLLPRIEEILRGFLRARLLVGGIKGLIAFGVLLALGFPGAYTLALLLGLFSILPVIGPLTAFLALALVGLADGGRTGGGLAGLGAAAALSVGLELLEGYVLLPRVVGRELGLSDFAVVLAMLCGGVLFGFFGVLIAVPAVAVAGVLYAEFLRPWMRGRADAGPA
jgi:predicted PurR-regulated permease PerM